MNRSELLSGLSPAARKAVEAQLEVSRKEKPSKCVGKHKETMALVLPEYIEHGAVSVWVPIRLYSEANLRQNWRAVHKRTKSQREAVCLMFLPVRKCIPKPPLRVKIVRYGAKLMDSDNLQRSAKAVRDEVAAIIGVDDGDPRVKYEYDQVAGIQYKSGKVWIHIAPAVPPKDQQV